MPQPVVREWPQLPADLEEKYAQVAIIRMLKSFNEVSGHSEAAPMNSTISAFSDDHGYVVVLLLRTELANFVHDRGQHRLWRQFSMPPHRIDQPFLPEKQDG